MEEMEKCARRYPRRSVSWACRLDLGPRAVIAGTVRDRSEGGICLEPEVAWTDGRCRIGPNAALSAAAGDSALAVIGRVPGGAESRRCRVVWTGTSAAHGCRAIGLEFLD